MSDKDSGNNNTNNGRQHFEATGMKRSLSENKVDLPREKQVKLEHQYQQQSASGSSNATGGGDGAINDYVYDESEIRMIYDVLSSNNSRNVDLNLIRHMIRINDSLPNRTNYVLNLLLDKQLLDTIPDTTNNVQPSTSTAARNDARKGSIVSNDVEVIEVVKDEMEAHLENMFPHVSKVIILNTLKKYPINHPDRLNVMINELLEHRVVEEVSEIIEDNSQLDEDVTKICAIVTDCDPIHIKNALFSYRGYENRVDLVVTKLIETRNYPRIKETLKKSRAKETLNTYLNQELQNMDEFLKLYPNPFQYFYNTELKVSKSYEEHCKVYLWNRYSRLYESTIASLMTKYHSHLTPIVDQIETALLGRGICMNSVAAPGEKAQFRKNYVHYKIRKEPREPVEYPVNLDEIFFKELLFVRHKTEINSFLINRQKIRDDKMKAARETNSLIECECCCDGELLDEDMITCDNSHSYCKKCVKSYIETNIGEGKLEFNCLNTNCKYEYTTKLLNELLEPKVYGILLRRMQEEDIRKAGIANLEMCLYCTYSAIIENPLDKVFVCMNPDCLKETCRLCKEPNHIPLRCDEVESRKEVDMRTYIENCISESMIRVCYNCKKRFYKTEGCNHMKCACGSEMCYICRQPIKGYTHFKDNTGCPQSSDNDKLHKQEMVKAYDEALKKYLSEHPDVDKMKLRYDPGQLIESMKAKIINQAAAPPQNEEDDDSDDDDSDDDDDDDDINDDYDTDEDYDDVLLNDQDAFQALGNALLNNNSTTTYNSSNNTLGDFSATVSSTTQSDTTTNSSTNSTNTASATNLTTATASNSFDELDMIIRTLYDNN